MCKRCHFASSAKPPLTRAALLSSALLGIACGGDQRAAPDGGAADDPRRLSLLPSAFERDLPSIETSDPNHDGVVDRYQATFAEVILPGGQRLVRTLGYHAEEDGSFRGRIELDFASGPAATTPFEHIEIIPKTFAATVDELEFSHPPTVLDPDPKVSWNISAPDETDIRISATQLVASSGAAGLSGEALAAYCWSQCAALEAGSEDAIGCALSVAHRFPDSAYIQELMASCGDEILCKVVEALVTGDWQTHCGTLPEEAAESCYVEVFNVHADETCKGQQSQGAEAVAQCLLGYWQQVADEHARDLLCFDRGFQEGINLRLDWSAFGAACAALATREHCEDIADRATRARCIAAHARAANDISLCDELGSDAAYGAVDCRHEFIFVRFAGPEECASFPDEESREMCRAIIFVREGDPSACLALASPTMRNACIATTVASAGHRDPQICDAMQREEGEYGEEERQWKHDFCVMTVAGHALDGAICERVEDEIWRAGCTVMFAMLSEEPVRACLKAQGAVFQCLCLGLAGEIHRDRSICEAIPDDNASAACVREVMGTGVGDTTSIEEACQELCVDQDDDAFFRDPGCHSPVDCDDGDFDVRPGAQELCHDRSDNDCDERVDCADDGCTGSPECAGPSQVVFTDHSGRYEVALSFPEGQGTGYRFVPEAELGYSVYGWGELVLVELAGYPDDSSQWPFESVPVVVSVVGAPALKSWRVYAASNASDPASRSTASWWENTSDPIPMRGDRFYWLYLYPETGPYAQEVLRLRGLVP